MFYRNLVLQLTAMVAILMFSSAVVVAANDTEVLKVGSKAPGLDIEHWVSNGNGKFEPVEDFESGKVYVVEFWATWCGPCIASMPHLSKLQKKFSEKGVQIISISDEELETVEEFLETSVAGDSEMTYAKLTGTYCLTADPDKSSHEDYMEAAEQEGIPSAFIVGKQGLIEWIGHPMEIDEPLDQVVSGKWDRVAFIAKKEAEEKAMADIQKRARSAMQKMQEGESDEAVEMLDGLIKDYADHPFIEQLKGLRFQVVIFAGGDKAAAAIAEFAAGNRETEELNQIAWMVVEMKMSGQDVDEKLLAAATKLANDAATREPENGAVLDTLAHLVHMGGDLDKAIEIQKRAVKHAGGQTEETEAFLEELETEKAKLNKSDDESDDQDD